MYWINFLHIYQPRGQAKDIFDRVVNESYRPLIKGLKENKSLKLNLNINACLTERLFKDGYQDVVSDLKFLAQRGQVEFTDSAAYHAFLPLLPETEIKRQINLNREINRKYFGKIYNPSVFFSPEMAYNKKIARIVKNLGYQWLILDEIAYNGKLNQASWFCFYEIEEAPGLKVLFKNRRISNLLSNALTRNIGSFKKEIGPIVKEDAYLLTAMDGETFGHHRPGLEKFLFQVLSAKAWKHLFISEALKHFQSGGKISPLDSTWTIEEEDLKEKKPYKLWHSADNPLQKLQWQFSYFVIKTVESLNHKTVDYQRARRKLDQSLESCQYWWASLYWWSLEMIEASSYNLRQIIFNLKTSTSFKKKAEKFYRQVLDLAFKWQRTGLVREFHKQEKKWQAVPFKERTNPEWYNQMILEFEAEMRRAAKDEEYERAIKWRDAIIKLKSGADVYDVLHVVNELWTVRRIPSCKPFLKYKKFSRFAKEYFLPFNYKPKYWKK